MLAVGDAEPTIPLPDRYGARYAPDLPVCFPRSGCWFPPV